MAELTAIQHADASSCCRPPQASCSCSKPAPSPAPTGARECPNHRFNGSFVPWVRAVNASNVYGVVEGVHNVGVSWTRWDSVVAHARRAFLSSRLLCFCSLRTFPEAVVTRRAVLDVADPISRHFHDRRRMSPGMRAALKLHTVPVVGACRRLGHLQSLEQSLLWPMRQCVGPALDSTRRGPWGKREAGAGSTLM